MNAIQPINSVETEKVVDETTVEEQEGDVEEDDGTLKLVPMFDLLPEAQQKAWDSFRLYDEDKKNWRRVFCLVDHIVALVILHAAWFFVIDWPALVVFVLGVVGQIAHLSMLLLADPRKMMIPVYHEEETRQGIKDAIKGNVWVFGVAGFLIWGSLAWDFAFHWTGDQFGINRWMVFGILVVHSVPDGFFGFNTTSLLLLIVSERLTNVPKELTDRMIQKDMTTEQAMEEAKLITKFQRQMRFVSQGMDLYIVVSFLSGIVALFAIFFTFNGTVRVTLWMNSFFDLIFPFPSVVEGCKSNVWIKNNIRALATADIASDWTMEERNIVTQLLRTAELEIKFMGKTMTWKDLAKTASSFASLFFLFFQLSRSPQIVEIIGIKPLLP